MSEQLAYVIITPYSLFKSRTGGIITRLITRTGLDLAAARMFSPSSELVQKYAGIIVSSDDPQDRPVQELIRDYILQNFMPDPKTGRRRRVMMLIFRGEDAVRKVRSVVGHIHPDRRSGETIRDTYGDIIMDDQGEVRYFEPAVLAAPTAQEVETKIQLWAQFSDSDGGIVENTIAYPEGVQPERTLVIIKPDNFRFATGRPGNVIDFFSRTGLYITGIKVHRMSVAEALEFYGPVRDVLRTKLNGMVGAKAKAVIEQELALSISSEIETELGNLLGPIYGDNQFENIVQFMAGAAPSQVPPSDHSKPGSEKCIALTYEGQNAVAKIRDVLGPTDPSKAPPGSIRREFGQNIMVNAAHASDSAESATRELKIVKVEENNFRRVVEQFYGK